MPDAILEHWFTLTINEQLGNVGSEVGRSRNWLVRGDADAAWNAFARGLDLLDRTLADDRWAGLRRREIARARECVGAAFLAHDLEDLAALERYFMQFAMAARAAR